MSFQYLTAEAVDSICQAALDSGLVAPPLRAVLAAGIHPGFFWSLRTMPDPFTQLKSDVIELNRVEQLDDGTVPLQVWLKNAATHLKSTGQPQAEVFAEHLDGFSRMVRGEPPVLRVVADAPELKERIVVENDMLPVSFLALGAEVARSVARLRVPQYEAGARVQGKSGIPLTHRGTGWMLTPTLMMTNHHVINARIARGGPAPHAAAADLERQAKEAEVAFDFDFEGQDGTPATVEGLELTCPEVDLDYAVLRLTAPNRAPLRVHALAPEAGRFAVNIIQHPEGGPKTVGLRNNLVTAVEPRALRYLTDTLGGSSGSPVCDDQWRVIALHRGSQRCRADYNGKRTAYVNVGTPLAAVFADLKTRSPALWAEVESTLA